MRNPNRRSGSFSYLGPKMEYLVQRLATFAWLLMLSCVILVASSRHGQYTPPNLTKLTDAFPRLSYNESFKEAFGGTNIQLPDNRAYVNLTLDKRTGSGFQSKEEYYYGFFSSAIKLPSGYSSGVVVAFYMSNAGVFPHNHDEIDVELLGHEDRKEWILQTNIYGNGSTHTGREEKFRLWFDPTQSFHQYSIIWNKHHTVFLVDNVPIREVNHSDAISSAYPSKPMSMYCTIWDGSEWATNGGKNPVNYKYAPFVASFREMEMGGCMWDSTKQQVTSCTQNNDLSKLDPVEGEEFTKLSQVQKNGMDEVRERFMIYSYCKDRGRFKVLPRECSNS